MPWHELLSSHYHLPVSGRIGAIGIFGVNKFFCNNNLGSPKSASAHSVPTKVRYKY